MASAKDIRVAPILAADANRLVRRLHYSGKVVPNSQVHLGVFLGGRLEGVMQFGPSMDKRKTVALVSDTSWNGFIELNRMAFSERLPRNSESRAISVAMRLIRKSYPHISWVISFADGCQCGDGAIYRASGFLLTGIKKNTGQRKDPETGEVFSQITFSAHRPDEKDRWKRMEVLSGYQLRYIYFLEPSARERLTVPVIPFSRIDEMRARMYKGQKILRAASIDSDASANLAEEGGANPTAVLHLGDDDAG